MNKTTKLLTKRGTTHGEFRQNSLISQEIKTTIRGGKNFSELKPYQAEALDMIVHKIGRILDGDPNFQDHWDDIEGYAKLAADRNREDNQ